MRRWGFSAQELIKDSLGRVIFDKFLETEFSSENIRFWLAIQELKKAPESEIEAQIEFIYKLIDHFFLVKNQCIMLKFESMQ